MIIRLLDDIDDKKVELSKNVKDYLNREEIYKI